MGKDRSHMTENILKLTLEIIYLLTGEDYGPVKKCKKRVTASGQLGVSEGWERRPQPSHRILELTNQIIELLGGEVSASYQEKSCDSSLEDWTECGRGKNRNMKLETSQHSRSPDFTDESDLSEASSSSSPAPSRADIGDNMAATRDASKYSPDVPDCDQRENVMGTAKTGRCPPPPCVKEELAPRAAGNLPDHSPYTPVHTTEKSTSGKSKTSAPSSTRPDPQRFADKYSHNGDDPFSAIKEEPLDITDQTFPSWPYTQSDGRFKKKDAMCYICVECGKSFPYKSHLLRHQKIHMEERPYSCLECGKSFKLNSNLISHQRIHTGEKPFSCSQCGKCFISKSELVKHARIHTGEKPYHCPECGRCFSRVSNLIDHSKIHTGEKPHCCTECGKCFRRHSNLLSHQKTHSVDKVFSCPQCTACFFSSTDLLAHQRERRCRRQESV